MHSERHDCLGLHEYFLLPREHFLQLHFFSYLPDIYRLQLMCGNQQQLLPAAMFNKCQKTFPFTKKRKKVNVHNNLMAFMSQTLSSWILFRVLCSEITVLSNSSCSSLVWKRMNISYFRHIVFSSGVKSFSNGFGYSKFLSSMNSFLRFLSSSLQRFSI